MQFKQKTAPGDQMRKASVKFARPKRIANQLSMTHCKNDFRAGGGSMGEERTWNRSQCRLERTTMFYSQETDGSGKKTRQTATGEGVDSAVQSKKTMPSQGVIQMLTERQAGMVQNISLTPDFYGKHIGGEADSKSQAKRLGEQKGVERNVQNSSLIMKTGEEVCAEILEIKSNNESAHAEITQKYGPQVHFRMTLSCSNFADGDNRARLRDNDCVLVGQWNNNTVSINHYEANLANFPPVNNDYVLPLEQITDFMEKYQTVVQRFREHYRGQQYIPPVSFQNCYIFYLNEYKYKGKQV